MERAYYTMAEACATIFGKARFFRIGITYSRSAVRTALCTLISELRSDRSVTYKLEGYQLVLADT